MSDLHLKVSDDGSFSAHGWIFVLRNDDKMLSVFEDTGLTGRKLLIEVCRKDDGDFEVYIPDYRNPVKQPPDKELLDKCRKKNGELKKLLRNFVDMVEDVT